MVLVQWNPAYSVNIAEFDSHHQTLVNLVNELHDAMRSGQGRTQLNKTLASLVEYTYFHFSAEEKVMKANQYPYLGSHQSEHHAFVKKVADFKSDLDAGKMAMSIQVIDFLKDWLINHIQKVDRQYSDFLNAKGVK